MQQRILPQSAWPLLLMALLAGCSSTKEPDSLDIARSTAVTSNMEAQVAALVVRYQRALKRAEEYEADVDEMQARADEAEMSLRAARALLKKTQAQVVAAQAEQAKGKQTLADLSQKTQAQQKQKKELSAKLTALQKEVAELEAQLKKAGASKEILARKVEDATKETALLAVEQERLDGSLVRLRDRINLLKSTLPGAEERIAALERELKRLKAQEQD